MNKHLSNIYDPLPLNLTDGEGAILRDNDQNEYIDFFSAYSATSFGHNHPAITKTVNRQTKRLNTTSRAIETQKINEFAQKICNFTEYDQVIPMNSGTEAVETALKAARLWGYRAKEIPENKAEIIVAKNNFHGRTISIISFSTKQHYRDGFGPYTPGFKAVEFGNIEDLREKINNKTCAVLLEPMQGEGGVNVPPDGYLKRVKKECEEKGSLLIIDEIQTGLARSGKKFAYQYDNISPDLLIVGKALGAGVHPVSALVGRKEVMSEFEPGMHGSTYGGNPIGCAIGIKAIELIENNNLAKRSQELGDRLKNELQALDTSTINDVRGKGLWLGVEVNTEEEAHDIVEILCSRGVLSKNTGNVLRLSPPLTIDERHFENGLNILAETLR